MNDAPSCNSSNYKIENIKRCFKCFKIPLIEINEKENEYNIKYYCENNHKGEVSIDNFLKEQKNFYQYVIMQSQQYAVEFLHFKKVKLFKK